MVCARPAAGRDRGRRSSLKAGLFVGAAHPHAARPLRSLDRTTVCWRSSALPASQVHSMTTPVHGVPEEDARRPPWCVRGRGRGRGRGRSPTSGVKVALTVDRRRPDRPPRVPNVRRSSRRGGADAGVGPGQGHDPGRGAAPLNGFECGFESHRGHLHECPAGVDGILSGRARRSAPLPRRVAAACRRSPGASPRPVCPECLRAPCGVWNVVRRGQRRCGEHIRV